MGRISKIIIMPMRFLVSLVQWWITVDISVHFLVNEWKLWTPVPYGIKQKMEVIKIFASIYFKYLNSHIIRNLVSLKCKKWQFNSLQIDYFIGLYMSYINVSLSHTKQFLAQPADSLIMSSMVLLSVGVETEGNQENMIDDLCSTASF